MTVVDKVDRIGGKLETLASPPEKSSFLLLRDYLYKQMVKMDIKFVQKDVRSAEDVKEFNPDAVIVATGSSQVLPPIKGIDSSNVVMAEDVINRKVKVGSTVAVIGGGLVGTETAKFLAAQGVKVHIIEMLDAIAKDMGPLFLGHTFEFLNKHGVEQHVNA